MHEVIGLQKHAGRVPLRQLVARPHFYGVGALEGLTGEITISDGEVTVTRVDANGQMLPYDTSTGDPSATLLIGSYISEWTEHRVAHDVAVDKLDEYITDLVKQTQRDLEKPSMFQIEGKFADVRFHVINGACPVHARIRKTEIPIDKKPFETELESVQGTMTGVFAKDAVGKITHPASSVHLHLVFKDPVSGKMVTGHVEKTGMLAGARIRLPAIR
jgi:alpha-acetolactate decarboxylase